MEVREEDGDDYNGYLRGGKDKDECNRLISLPENYKKSISSLFENS